MWQAIVIEYICDFWTYHTFVIEDRDVSEQRAFPDNSGTYYACSSKTPTKTKIINFKQNDVKAFVHLYIHPIILFRIQYCLQKDFARFYFLLKITAGKFSNLQVIRHFHILLQHSASVERSHVINYRKNSLNRS